MHNFGRVWECDAVTASAVLLINVIGAALCK
jgi:hypothetical protein